MSPAGSTVTLSTPLLRLTVDPAAGGKLRSLVSLATGRDLLWQYRRADFDAARGYSWHDMSGMDECFPTVGPCRGRTADGDEYDYDDHGSLWQGPWEARRVGEALETRCILPSLGCTFRRCISFPSDGELLLSCEITNTGTRRLPFVYSAHPLLACDAHTTVSLPAEMRRAYVYMAGPGFGAADRTWIDLPRAGSAGGAVRAADVTGPYALDRRTFVKMFSDRLSDGTASVHYARAGAAGPERLQVGFDTAALPHLGFLACQGHDSLGDGFFGREFLLALEPTTGIGDDIATCESTGTLAHIRPGEERRHWIRFSVHPA